MRKDLAEAIIKDFRENTKDWKINYGTAEREKPFVKIECHWKNVVVGGVTQRLKWWQWKHFERAIDDEAARRFAQNIAPGKENADD